MDFSTPGLHHLTAITGDASGNVAFYTRTLGLRLVKKTVNQDDVSAYHLFYGDAAGRPGTEVTFFDWPASPPARPGPATIAPFALRVPSSASLVWWSAYFDEAGVAHGEVFRRDGRTLLEFRDPEGQRLELVDDGGAPGGTPWSSGSVPVEHGIKGLHGVTITSTRPEESARLLTGLMGFRRTGGYPLDSGEGAVAVFESGAGGPGTEVRVVATAARGLGSPGIGGVHHVAFQVPDEERQREWREVLARAGLGVTPVIDRFYFKSVYFREPGGALFEIATSDGPGFLADEPLESLGRRLALPPFLEPRRAQIEAGLTPIEVADPA